MHSTGLIKGDYAPFLGELASRGASIEAEAVLLSIPLEGIVQTQDPKKLPEDITQFDAELGNGDRVVLRKYNCTESAQEGRFVTGFDPQTGKYAFISERDSGQHVKLAEEINSHGIIEAGFMRVTPRSATIELFGESDTFKVSYGNISYNLLHRALQKWTINS